MNRLSSLYGKLLDFLAVLAALLLLVMIAIVTGDILLRNFFRFSLIWSNEVSEYALYLITLLTAPWLLRRGQHIRLDLILTIVPARVAWLMEAVGDIFGFAICAVMIRYGWLMTYEAFRLNAITIKTLIFPEWWLLAPMPLTFLLLAIEFIFRFHRLMLNRNRREEATSVA